MIKDSQRLVAIIRFDHFKAAFFQRFAHEQAHHHIVIDDQQEIGALFLSTVHHTLFLWMSNYML